MGDFWHHYWEIFADPAHLAAEITFLLLVDILLLGIIWPLIRRQINKSVKREHHIIDSEHGIVHPNPKEEAHL